MTRDTKQSKSELRMRVHSEQECVDYISEKRN